MAAMGRVRTALQFRNFVLIESRKDVETDLKPLCAGLQYSLGLWQKPVSNESSWTTALYSEEKSHQKLFDKPQNHCLIMTSKPC